MALFSGIFAKRKTSAPADAHLVVGLGNPGREYESTRHNIGWMLVDELARDSGATLQKEARFNAEVCRAKLAGKDCFIIKPLTYMNESGIAVGALMRYYGLKPERVIVAHDEFQIAVGEMKLTIGGGDGGHNGIASIMSHIGNGFVRLRLGIGSTRPLESGLKGFVLGKFEAPERELLSARMADFASAARLVVDRGPVIAMNQLNKRTKHNDRNATA